MPRLASLDPTKTGRSAEHLANKPSQLVVGQDEAIQQIVRAYQTHVAGLSPVSQPIGNFLFPGANRLRKNSYRGGDCRSLQTLVQ
jgi:hypothetical protein